MCSASRWPTTARGSTSTRPSTGSERHILLKVAFPVDVLSPAATYEIQWGNVERPTHRNTSWDWARFETCAQKWVDLSEGDYGVSLLNDCKYGHDIRDNVMRISLLRGPTAARPRGRPGRAPLRLQPAAARRALERDDRRRRLRAQRPADRPCAAAPAVGCRSSRSACLVPPTSPTSSSRRSSRPRTATASSCASTRASAGAARCTLTTGFPLARRLAHQPARGQPGAELPVDGQRRLAVCQAVRDRHPAPCAVHDRDPGSACTRENDLQHRRKSHEQADTWRDRRQPGFFPAHLCEKGRKTILKVLEEEGINAICLTPAGHQLWQHRQQQRRREVRRPVQEACRRDRRHPGHPAQLRRRARHRQRHALVRAQCARADPRLSR